ncbi:MAG: CRISPR-associated helicase Cas3' [Ignisphaera sp.]
MSHLCSKFSSGRALIDTLSNYIYSLNKFDRVIVVEAPTGYGKSVGAPIVGALNYTKNFSYNFIHVLPLRAIVEDLYLCKYLAAVTSCKSTKCRALPPNVFIEALKTMEIGEGDIAYQMGLDHMIRGVGVKEPTYDAKVMVSTLDSFAYTFFRIPVTEMFREVKHYAIPRARIFTSTVFLDEVHMLKRFDDESSERALAFLKILLEFSIKTSTPVVLATATLWSRFRETLATWCEGKIIFFTLSNRDEKSGSTVYVRDREFEDAAKSIKWVTSIVEEKDLVAKINEHSKCDERVLVVRDTIRLAVDTYNKIDVDSNEKVLIHSRLCLKDREDAVNRARTAKVVVATPIIEAGVDWDFDVGFRDATNTPSAIQVFGRICRSRRDCEASVYLVKVKNSLRELIEYINMNRYIDWRIPYSYTRNGVEFKGYSEVLEKSATITIDVDENAERIFRALTAPIFLPSKYIESVLEITNYSILKEPLTQFYVYGYNKLENSRNSDDIISGTFTYSLELVQKQLRCIDYFVCVVDREGELITSFRKNVLHTTINSVEYAKLYKECIKSSSESRGRPIFIGFVLKENCYRNGLGFVGDE